MKRNLRKTAARKPREQPTGLIIAGGWGGGPLVKKETTENRKSVKTDKAEIIKHKIQEKER